MKTLHVKASTHQYPILVGENLRHQLKTHISTKYTSVLIVTDHDVATLYLEDVLQNFTNENVYHVIIPSGEKSKDIDTYYKLQTKALEFGLDRQSVIIALGGGVVGDLAGFV